MQFRVPSHLFQISKIFNLNKKSAPKDTFSISIYHSLYNTLRQHRFGYFNKACNVCTFYIVNVSVSV